MPRTIRQPGKAREPCHRVSDASSSSSSRCSRPSLAAAQTWTADNGNGTYTNPLFYDEFSDPDLIRVGDDFYLTGTTMHAMPGLPVLHSTDLVNWELVGYALDRLDLGPEYRLEGGRDLRPGHLGAELPLARRHLPHLHERQRADDAALHRHGPAGAVDAHGDEAVVPRPVRALRRRRRGVRRVGLPGHASRAARQHAHRHRARQRARAVREGRGDGRGGALLQDRREVLHHERVVRGPHAPRLRARRPHRRAVGGEPGDQHRRGVRHARGTAAARQRHGPGDRRHPGESHGPRPHRHASGRHRPHPGGRVVGVVDDRGQFGRAADRAVPGDLARRVAVLRSPGQPRPHAAHVGEAAHGLRGRAARALPARRRLLGPGARQRLAVEPRPRRLDVVARRAPRLPAAARAPRPGFLAGAQLAHAARDRPAVHTDDDPRDRRHAGRATSLGSRC